MNNYVILSPHFDDGVLSCGGRIWQAIRAEKQVRVISIFAGGPLAEVPPFAQVQHEKWGNPPDANRLRRAEDVAAYARLGCFDLCHLDAPDAVYRVAKDKRPLYGTEAAIFGFIQPEESTYAEHLTEEIIPYLLSDAMILAPLGVGHHVDHLLGYAIGSLLRQKGYLVAFYEELPYIEAQHALDQALADKPTWQPEIATLSEAALAAKVDAMGYYRSQIPVLYGNDLSMSRRIRAVANEVAGGTGYSERIWWPAT